MSYSAVVIPVMIASPGDVSEERNLIRDIIHEWNDINSMRTGAALLPVGWETQTSPELGARPQALINKNVLDTCDLLVGVFWTRIGTPTGEAESGTAEEIRRHVEAGKPAMVYFSTAPVAPETLDRDQFQALTEFKEWCRSQGLIEEYANLPEFSNKFRRQVQLILRDNDHLKSIYEASDKLPGIGSPNNGNTVSEAARHMLDDPIGLSHEAQKLLVEASRDNSGTIISMRHLNGHAIQTNSINLADSGDRRSVARWEAALEELLLHDLIVARGYKNEIFQVTDKGYKLADTLKIYGI